MKPQKILFIILHTSFPFYFLLNKEQRKTDWNNISLELCYSAFCCLLMWYNIITAYGQGRLNVPHFILLYSSFLIGLKIAKMFFNFVQLSRDGSFSQQEFVDILKAYTKVCYIPLSMSLIISLWVQNSDALWIGKVFILAGLFLYFLLSLAYYTNRVKERVKSAYAEELLEKAVGLFLGGLFMINIIIWFYMLLLPAL